MKKHTYLFLGLLIIGFSAFIAGIIPFTGNLAKAQIPGSRPATGGSSASLNCPAGVENYNCQPTAFMGPISCETRCAPTPSAPYTPTYTPPEPSYSGNGSFKGLQKSLKNQVLVNDFIKKACENAKNPNKRNEIGGMVATFKNGDVKKYEGVGVGNRTSFSTALGQLNTDQGYNSDGSNNASHGATNDYTSLTVIHSHQDNNYKAKYGMPPSIRDFISNINLFAVDAPNTEHNFYVVDGGDNNNGKCNKWQFGANPGSKLYNQIKSLLSKVPNINSLSDAELSKYVSKNDSEDLFNLLKYSSLTDATVPEYLNLVKKAGGFVNK